MIFECPSGHICFSKDELTICGMRRCNKQIDMLSPDDIKWFYKINKNGLCIARTDLHMIIEDHNMLKEVKTQIQKIFTNFEFIIYADANELYPHCHNACIDCCCYKLQQKINKQHFKKCCS